MKSPFRRTTGKGATLGRIQPRQVRADEVAAPPPPRRAKASGGGYKRVRPAIATEFQPDAVEVEEAPPSFIAFLTLYSILALVVCFVTWASFAEVDRVVTANGRIVSSKPHITLQSFEMSVIRAINVRQGDTVKKGDVLVTLDPTFANADLTDLESQFASYQAEIRRLEAELEGTVFNVDPVTASPDDLLQLSLHRRRVAAYVAQIESFDQEVKRGQAAANSAEDDIRVLSDRLRIAGEIVTMRNTLREQQVGSQLNYLLATNDRLSVARDLDRARNSKIDAEHLIQSSQAKRSAFAEDWRRETIDQLVVSRRKAGQLGEQIHKAERRKDLITLTAPEDGVVLTTIEKAPGAVVEGGTTLVSLVPADSPMEVEARIATKDIGSVGLGDDVRVKLEAFPFSRHGSAKGRLVTIGRDSVTDRQKDTDAFYLGRVTLEDIELRQVSSDFHLIPGMTVVAEISVGKRSILSYLTGPVVGTVSDAMRDSSY